MVAVSKAYRIKFLLSQLSDAAPVRLLDRFLKFLSFSTSGCSGRNDPCNDFPSFRDHDGPAFLHLSQIMAQFVLEISDTSYRFQGNCPPSIVATLYGAGSHRQDL